MSGIMLQQLTCDVGGERPQNMAAVTFSDHTVAGLRADLPREPADGDASCKLGDVTALESGNCS